ncbi:hypothetical protein T310_7962 [Rasamsonia emersonii CBS 393.64]|uniref:Uncharacterized protein n=1 Tax=Rasamsonia emersonii (strain ATCC 16479 / CBS 393.64 / IMI 116815) TaxID=1408163 RepID=A0A0F4YJ00_RASE3|nr:hypothetical protein T310_7962 [Rasamsonia emersonii CBS 393.64]KKA18095.1 hypothetical protein T310_7962 [Rasamsonia emersonii CBS 393.64]
MRRAALHVLASITRVQDSSLIDQLLDTGHPTLPVPSPSSPIGCPSNPSVSTCACHCIGVHTTTVGTGPTEEHPHFCKENHFLMADRSIKTYFLSATDRQADRQIDSISNQPTYLPTYLHT